MSCTLFAYAHPYVQCSLRASRPYKCAIHSNRYDYSFPARTRCAFHVCLHVECPIHSPIHRMLVFAAPFAHSILRRCSAQSIYRIYRQRVISLTLLRLIHFERPEHSGPFDLLSVLYTLSPTATIYALHPSRIPANGRTVRI